MNIPAAMPTGAIIAWAPRGNARVPRGWAICNGANGTPDLRNRFLYGASRRADAGQEIGDDIHEHVVAGTVTGRTEPVIQQSFSLVSDARSADRVIPNRDHRHRVNLTFNTTTQPQRFIPRSIKVLFLQKI